MSQAFFVHLWVSLGFSISIPEATAYLSNLISWLAIHPFWSEVILQIGRHGARCPIPEVYTAVLGRQGHVLYTCCVLQSSSTSITGELIRNSDRQVSCSLTKSELTFYKIFPTFTGSLKLENWYRSSSSWKMPWAASQACSCGQC